MREQLIIGNWKMHCLTQEAKDLVTDIESALVKAADGASSSAAAGSSSNATGRGAAAPSYVTADGQARTVVVCPTFTSLAVVAPLCKRVGLGAQDVYPAVSGAFTGEVSAPMLKDAGASYVIVGHSERRELFGESNAFCLEKVRALLLHGLRPILCVGESLAQREAGETESWIGSQIRECLADLTAEDMASVIIAYEPIWAIGTGKTATAEQANETCAFIRKTVAGIWEEAVAQSLPILYGGSVKPDNAAELLAQPDIDGALVGGASLTVADFMGIVEA